MTEPRNEISLRLGSLHGFFTVPYMASGGGVMSAWDLFLYVIAAVGGLIAAPFVIAIVGIVVAFIVLVITAAFAAWAERKSQEMGANVKPANQPFYPLAQQAAERGLIPQFSPESDEIVYLPYLAPGNWRIGVVFKVAA